MKRFSSFLVLATCILLPESNVVVHAASNSHFLGVHKNIVTESTNATTVSATNEGKLITKLLADYVNMERPVADSNSTLNVSMGISLLKINMVDKNELNAIMWLNMQWNDTYLQWNPAEYGNISSVKLPISSIWAPDIYAYNSVHELFDPTFKTLAVVEHYGLVMHVPPGIHKVQCTGDYKFYPFDERKCHFEFGSWASGGGVINLTYMDPAGGDLSSYVTNNEWKLIGGLPVNRTAKFYACCTDPYVDVTFLFHLQRRGGPLLFYAKMINIFICFMVLISFSLSPSSGQKLIPAIGALICNVRVITSFAEDMSLYNESQLSKYFMMLFVLAFLSLLANVFTLFLYRRTGRMPRLMQSILLEKIPTLFGHMCQQRRKLIISPSSQARASIQPGGSRNIIEDISLDNDSQRRISDIDNLRKRISIQEENLRRANDWKYLASMADKCFIILYILCILIFIILFPSFDELEE